MNGNYLDSTNQNSNNSNRIRTMRYFFFAVACILVAGCASKGPVTTGIGLDAKYEFGQLTTSQQVDNPQLNERLTINSAKSKITNDLLVSNVVLTSQYQYSQNLQYQFTWFDGDGFVIEPNQQAWKALQLHGGQQINLAGIAPNASARAFKFYVRYANEQAYKFDQD
ncbi:YcfL family protein [Colwellia sp. MEBiC06753]